jgi:two-component system nitrate/nitrite response regulator NarL
LANIERAQRAIQSNVSPATKLRNNLMIVGPGRLAREALTAMLNHRHFTVLGEGANLFEARYSMDPAAVPDAVIYNMSRSEDVGDALAQLRLAQSDFPSVKAVLIADSFSNDDVLRILHTGVNAILSPDISAKLLLNSLELVMLGQHLYPTLPTNLLAFKETEARQQSSATESVAGRLFESSVLPAISPIQSSIESAVIVPLPSIESTVTPIEPISARMMLAQDGRTQASGDISPLALSDREIEILRCLVNGSPNKVIARALGIAETTVKVHVKGLLRKVRASNRTQAAVWALNHYFVDKRA